MNRIRINVLIKYYLESLNAIVDECYKVKNAYTDGQMSYRHAWKKLDRLMKTGWQRAKLVKKLGKSLDYTPKGLTDAENELYSLTDWVAD